MLTFTTRHPHAHRTQTSARQPWTLAGVAGAGVAALLCLADGPPTDLLHVARLFIASVSSGLMIGLLLTNSPIHKILSAANRRGRLGMDGSAIKPCYWQLQQVAGVTDDLFIAWYIPFLNQVSTEQLRRITNALKRRQSRLMGTQLGHEAARQQRDRWTYAVFLVASLSISSETNCHTTSNRSGAVRDLCLLLEIIPDSARLWLTASPDICHCIVDALLFQSDENPVWSLLTPAATPLARKVTNSTADQRSLKTPADRGPSPTSSAGGESDTANRNTAHTRVATQSKFGALGLLRIKD